MTYEIRVVFQSAQAYQSAVEGLYRAFGVDVGDPAARAAGNGVSGELLEQPITSLDSFLAQDPTFVDDAYSFTVEDQTELQPRPWSR
jgi:hypothetical protein